MSSLAKYLLISVVLGCIMAVSSFGADKMLGPGVWSVINTEKCEDDDQYLNKVTIDRHRLNRSHDYFDGTLKLMQTIDDSFAVRMVACKYVDGGCKPFQEVLDDCFCCFMKKYAESNFFNLLIGLGVDPADCPVPAGDYSISNYIYDYDSLPSDGMYGKFLGHVFLLKDEVAVGCAAITAEFNERT